MTNDVITPESHVCSVCGASGFQSLYDVLTHDETHLSAERGSVSPIQENLDSGSAERGGNDEQTVEADDFDGEYRDDVANNDVDDVIDSCSKDAGDECDILLDSFSEGLLMVLVGILDEESVGRLMVLSRRWWRCLSRYEPVYRQFCMRVYPAQYVNVSANVLGRRKLKRGEWRRMFLSRPRVRTTGVYSLKVSYVKNYARDMWTEVPVGTILEVVYYRHLRFERDGRVRYSLLHAPLGVYDAARRVDALARTEAAAAATLALKQQQHRRQKDPQAVVASVGSQGPHPSLLAPSELSLQGLGLEGGSRHDRASKQDTYTGKYTFERGGVLAVQVNVGYAIIGFRFTVENSNGATAGAASAVGLFDRLILQEHTSVATRSPNSVPVQHTVHSSANQFKFTDCPNLMWGC